MRCSSLELLMIEELGVHAHYEYLLVMRAVEDPYLPAPRQALGVPPQKVVGELFHRRDLELWTTVP